MNNGRSDAKERTIDGEGSSRDRSRLSQMNKSVVDTENSGKDDAECCRVDLVPKLERWNKEGGSGDRV